MTKSAPALPLNPMLIDFETLTPHTDAATRKPVRRPRPQAIPAPTATALWNDDDLAGMLRAEAEERARDDAIQLLDDYRAMLEEIGAVRTIDLAGLRENTEVLVAGQRVSTARDGKKALVISLQDGTGLSDAAFASEAQSRAGSVLFGTELMLIAATTTKDLSLRATNAWDLKKLHSQWAAQQREGADIGS